MQMKEDGHRLRCTDSEGDITGNHQVLQQKNRGTGFLIESNSPHYEFPHPIFPHELTHHFATSPVIIVVFPFSSEL